MACLVICGCVCACVCVCGNECVYVCVCVCVGVSVCMWCVWWGWVEGECGKCVELVHYMTTVNLSHIHSPVNYVGVVFSRCAMNI